MAEFSTLVKVSELEKRYKDAVGAAVDQISFSVREGETFGLLGPNGAGKTSTIKMLCGLLQPTGGSIEVCGFDIKQDVKKIKPLIGVVPQDIALYLNLTADENLTIFSRLYGQKGKTAKARINELLHTFGLERHRSKKVDAYSGGMKRRLNLIVALIHNPRVLFLDEPTVGIDIQSKVVILENLKKINQQGTAMIYTSHQMEETEALCSNVAIIDHGKLIIEGSPQNLIQQVSSAHNLEDVYLHVTGKRLRD